MGVEFVHGDISRAVQYYKWELGQVDLMDLVEDLLANIGIAARLFLFVQIVQLRVAIEHDIETGWRDLRAGSN